MLHFVICISVIGLTMSSACQALSCVKIFQSKAQVTNSVSRFQGPGQAQMFVKDRPVLAFKITPDNYDQLPRQIVSRLGLVDTTEYTDEYLQKKIGGAVILQFEGDTADFYVIGKDDLEHLYRPISFAELQAKNSTLLNKVKTAIGSNLCTSEHLISVLKTQPVHMYRMSTLGYPIQLEAVIASPWGTQTKPAGQDAFLAFSHTDQQYYMVNVDSEGLPIGYKPFN